MPEYIRLKHKVSGTEFTVSADIELGDDVTVIDKPATDSAGHPLSPRYKDSAGAAGGETPDGPPDGDITILTPARKAVTPKE